MITSLFKNNLLSYFIVSVLGLLIWGIAYFDVKSNVDISIEIANKEYFFSKQTGILFNFLITLFGATFLNYKLKKYLFSYEPTNLFLLFYVVITSFGLMSNNIISFSLTSLLLILMVNYLFYFIEDKKQEDQVFNSSFIIGLLVFQNISFLLLIPLLVLNLGAVKRISFKEFALIFIGLILPFVFVILFSFLSDNFDVLDSMFQTEINFPKIPWKFGLFFLILIVLSISGYGLVITKRSGIDINILRLTKNMFVYFITTILIVCLSLFLFQKEYIAFIFGIPLSIFLADYFANSSSKSRELLVLAVILFPFLHIFIK